MFAHQRHLEIARALERQGGVKVSTLARRFEVAEETIRRDLLKMEAENLLVRTHGGALPVETPQSSPPYHMREIAEVESKKAIARHALGEIEEEDTIFMDGSTTAYQLARIFPDLRCTVITHSEPIFSELCRRTNVELISTGGLYDRRSASFVGPLAEQLISTCQINKAFLGCKGIDFKRGFSDASVRHMNLKRSVIDWAETVYILADHSKMDQRSRYFFAALNHVSKVITDHQTTPAQRSALQRSGVQLMVSKPSPGYSHAT
ncbi:MAG: DeoR/GlpR transcriptional regulator [Verrucomicrobia bacterium]|nr:DeoR/GlpR transcriptional regulator [Verrucomicrobiota bacterium]MCH8511040.1 DeoR/GlpR family DNA-binding transcription regulator [Kiritimatiellia bacterium]